jgi:hypothetical protein
MIAVEVAYDDEPRTSNGLILNGELVRGATVYHHDNDDRPGAIIDNEEIVDLLVSCSVSELLNHFYQLELLRDSSSIRYVIGDDYSSGTSSYDRIAWHAE